MFLYYIYSTYKYDFSIKYAYFSLFILLASLLAKIRNYRFAEGSSRGASYVLLWVFSSRRFLPVPSGNCGSGTILHPNSRSSMSGGQGVSILDRISDILSFQHYRESELQERASVILDTSRHISLQSCREIYQDLHIPSFRSHISRMGKTDSRSDIFAPYTRHHEVHSSGWSRRRATTPHSQRWIHLRVLHQAEETDLGHWSMWLWEYDEQHEW